MNNQRQVAIRVIETARAGNATAKAQADEDLRIAVLPYRPGVSGPVDTSLEMCHGVFSKPHCSWKEQMKMSAGHAVEVGLSDVNKGQFKGRPSANDLAVAISEISIFLASRGGVDA